MFSSIAEIFWRCDSVSIYLKSVGDPSLDRTVNILLVERDVGTMLSALSRHERDLELRRSQRQDAVGNVLSRRSVDSNLQCAFPGTAYINWNTVTQYTVTISCFVTVSE